MGEELKLFLQKLEQDQKEFDKKYPTEKDKLIYWILNSINVNNVEKEELMTWNDEELNDYLVLCELIDDERQMIKDGLYCI